MAATLVDLLGANEYLAVGARWMKLWRCTLDSSYPTGGEPVSASALGFSDHASSLIVVCNFNVVVCDYDGANAKIRAYFGDYNNAADGILIEVANTTDLSTAVGILTVLGEKPSQ